MWVNVQCTSNSNKPKTVTPRVRESRTPLPTPHREARRPRAEANGMRKGRPGKRNRRRLCAPTVVRSARVFIIKKFSSGGGGGRDAVVVVVIVWAAVACTAAAAGFAPPPCSRCSSSRPGVVSGLA